MDTLFFIKLAMQGVDNLQIRGAGGVQQGNLGKTVIDTIGTAVSGFLVLLLFTNCLMQKSQPFIWTPECQSSFDMLHF